MCLPLRTKICTPSSSSSASICLLTPDCEVIYKVSDYYAPDCESGVIWNDRELAIDWPLDGLTPQLSLKDQQGVSLSEAETFA